jgi:hypothetical protein
MAQGSLKNLSKKKPSAGAQKRKVVRAKTTVAKGRCKDRLLPSKKHESQQHRETVETSKTINRKNEALIAAKAVGNGTQFFLSDIATKGAHTLHRQLKERDKKQSKGNANDRLKAQLRKLGKNV